ncbi:MAG: hypothetical protein ACYCTB_11440 [bacterium]
MELLNNNKQISIKALNDIREFILSLFLRSGFGARFLDTYFTKTMHVLIVPDANVIIGEIIWLATKRKCKKASTDLMKIAKSGIAKLHVPHIIDKEIERNISKVAKQYGIDSSCLKTEYREYKKLFTYNNNMPLKNGKDIKTPNTNVINDVIYIKLAIRKNANIYSKDNHIKNIKDKNIDFNIKTISNDEINLLKDYNNGAIYVVSIEIAGYSFITLIIFLIINVIELLKIKKISSIIVFILCGIALYLIFNKQAREIVVNKGKDITISTSQKISEIMTEYQDKKIKINEIEKKINLITD